MGTIRRFEDLEIWQLARELLHLIYNDFRDCKDFTFKNQIIAAGLSIMNNIAEGFSRNSDKEFKQFLNISKGSDGPYSACGAQDNKTSGHQDNKTTRQTAHYLNNKYV